VEERWRCSHHYPLVLGFEKLLPAFAKGYGRCIISTFTRLRRGYGG